MFKRTLNENFSNDFYWTLRQRLQEGPAIGPGQDATVEDDNYSLIALCSDQRPTPCRSFRIASGKEYSMNGSPPRSSTNSSFASINGWSGTANGSRVMITFERASPGTSTPIQKLSVPKSTLRGVALNCSSKRPRGAPPPCTKRLNFFREKNSPI